MDTKGLSIGDKTYVSKDGLNANNQTITNVKDGKIEEGSKDAVNGGQLYATNQLVKDNASNISLLGNSINRLDNRVDKVGAGQLLSPHSIRSISTRRISGTLQQAMATTVVQVPWRSVHTIAQMKTRCSLSVAASAMEKIW